MTATLEALPEDRPSADQPSSPPPQPARPLPAALEPWHDPRPWLGWVITAALGVFTAFTRFWGLGHPNSYLFDEVYYAKEAQELLRYGYEDNRGYLFIVHPPLGKWLIAASSAIWGNNPIGWRVAPAVFGCLGVVVLTRLARRMFRSNLFGGIAGLLLACDGLSLVLGRTAILDIFLQFFVLAGFAALVVDRDRMRARLAALVASGADLSSGVPTLGPRPWRLAAGVLLGLGLAVKWSALSFFLLFALLSLVWDRAALKSAGVRKPWRAAVLRSWLPAFGSLLLAPLGAYLLTYLGWFTGENGFDRHWSDTHGTSARLDLFGLHVPFSWAWVPGPVRTVGSDIYRAYQFHESLTSPHSYQSSPWSWLVDGRPVDFAYNGNERTCGASSCAREVLLLGTPLLWWSFAPALLWVIWRYLTTRDWRAAAVLVAFAAGWLVWFQDLARTMFLFYMAPLVPFMILGITFALGAVLGPGRVRTGHRAGDARTFRRRRWGAAAVSAYLAVVIVDFAWMWPVFTGGLLTYAQWQSRMWLPSWV